MDLHLLFEYENKYFICHINSNEYFPITSSSTFESRKLLERGDQLDVL